MVVTGQITLGPLAKGVGAVGGPRPIVGPRATTAGHGRVRAREARVPTVAGDDAVVAPPLPVQGGRTPTPVGAAGRAGGFAQALAAPGPAAGAGRPAQATSRSPVRPANGPGPPVGAGVLPPRATLAAGAAGAAAARVPKAARAAAVVAGSAARLLVVAAGGTAPVQVGPRAETREPEVAVAVLQPVEVGPLQVLALAVRVGEPPPPVVRVSVREAVLPPIGHLVRPVVLPGVAFAGRHIATKEVGVVLPLGKVPGGLAVVGARAGAPPPDGRRVLEVVRAAQGGRPPQPQESGRVRRPVPRLAGAIAVEGRLGTGPFGMPIRGGRTARSTQAEGARPTAIAIRGDGGPEAAAARPIARTAAPPVVVAVRGTAGRPVVEAPGGRGDEGEGTRAGGPVRAPRRPPARWPGPYPLTLARDIATCTCFRQWSTTIALLLLANSSICVPLVASITQFESPVLKIPAVAGIANDPVDHAGDGTEAGAEAPPEALRVPTAEAVRSVAPVGPVASAGRLSQVGMGVLEGAIVRADGAPSTRGASAGPLGIGRPVPGAIPAASGGPTSGRPFVDQQER